VEDAVVFKSSRKVEQETVVVGSSKKRDGLGQKKIKSAEPEVSTKQTPKILPAQEPLEKDPQKAIRMLQKKLRQIDALLEARDNGSELNEDQLTKIGTKPLIEKEIQGLQDIVNKLE
jgi:uncharacterized protein with WD repeat